MGDYDLQIMVAVIFSAILFSGFMILYVQEPASDYVSQGNESMPWDQSQDATDTAGVFSMLDSLENTEIFLVRLYVAAMGVVGIIIVARYLRGV